MNPQGKKFVVLIAAVILAWYAGDAIYPTWNSVCKGNTLPSGLNVPAASTPHIADEKRVLRPVQPPGCTITPNNGLRKAFNYFYPLPEGYPKEQL